MALGLLPVSTQCEVSEMGSTGECDAGHVGFPSVRKAGLCRPQTGASCWGPPVEDLLGNGSAAAFNLQLGN